MLRDNGGIEYCNKYKKIVEDLEPNECEFKTNEEYRYCVSCEFLGEAFHE